MKMKSDEQHEENNLTESVRDIAFLAETDKSSVEMDRLHEIMVELGQSFSEDRKTEFIEKWHTQRAKDGDTDQILHTYHVLDDTDFHDAVNKLRADILKTWDLDPLLSNATFNFRTIAIGVNVGMHEIESYMQATKRVAHYFCISVDDLMNYADGFYQYGILFGKDDEHDLGGIDWNEEIGLYYKIGPLTTLRSITADWKNIETRKKREYGKAKTRLRPPATNHALLYAIFKARKRHSFKDIYEMYEDGKLPGYSGLTTQYKTIQSLEKFFNRHSPVIKKDT